MARLLPSAGKQPELRAVAERNSHPPTAKMKGCARAQTYSTEAGSGCYCLKNSFMGSAVALAPVQLSSIDVHESARALAIAFGADLFNVAKEPGMPSLLPIRRFIVVSPGPETQEAEEKMFRRFGDDTDVPSPNHQITGLRFLDALEFLYARVNFRRRRIAVRETSALVDRMDKMRAVALGMQPDSGMERSRDNRRTLIRAERRALQMIGADLVQTGV